MLNIEIVTQRIGNIGFISIEFKSNTRCRKFDDKKILGYTVNTGVLDMLYTQES